MNTYQFRILDPRRVDAHPDAIPLSNQLYTTWKAVFSKVVEDAGGVLDPDDYFRSSFALVIYSGTEIVGFSMCTEFDLRLYSSLEHHYWRALDTTTVEKLQRKNVNRIMSMEYLTVLDKWRKNEERISWAEVLVGLGLFYQDHFPMDAMIGTPRADLTMSATCEGMGGISVQTPIQKMNYPCAVQIFDRKEVGQRHFNNLSTNRQVSELWADRTDFRMPTTPQKAA